MIFFKLSKVLGLVVVGRQIKVWYDNNNLKKKKFLELYLPTTCFAVDWYDDWDRRSTYKAASGTKKRKLIFVRHGKFSYKNNEFMKKGALTAEGVAEIENATHRLVDIIKKNNYNVRIVQSSSSLEAVESRVIVEEVLKMKDISFTKCLTYPPSNECLPNIKEPLLASSPKGVPKPSLQNVYESAAIAESVFREIFFRPLYKSNLQENVLDIYIGHSNLHRWLMLRALQLPLEAYLRFSNSFGSFNEFTIYSDGNVVCDTVGEVSHIFKGKNQVGVMSNNI